jgi:hypothetical protein
MVGGEGSAVLRRFHNSFRASPHSTGAILARMASSSNWVTKLNVASCNRRAQMEPALGLCRKKIIPATTLIVTTRPIRLCDKKQNQPSRD